MILSQYLYSLTSNSEAILGLDWAGISMHNLLNYSAVFKSVVNISALDIVAKRLSVISLTRGSTRSHLFSINDLLCILDDWCGDCVCTLLCSTVASWPSLPWSSWSKSVRVELDNDWITAETGSTNQHSTWTEKQRQRIKPAAGSRKLITLLQFQKQYKSSSNK